MKDQTNDNTKDPKPQRPTVIESAAVREASRAMVRQLRAEMLASLLEQEAADLDNNTTAEGHDDWRKR